MKNAVTRLLIILTTLLVSCDGMLFVNSKTSEIGNLNSYCIENNTWDTLRRMYSINEVKDSSFVTAIRHMREHWTTPPYILYFKDYPEEIIACDYYSVRLVYNPKLSSQILDGLDDSLLTDKQQVRVRNRIINLLTYYSCDTGKVIFGKELSEPAVFSKEYYEKRKKWYNIFD